jgi:photosystem II stability/assembly factor-like uncharacterized protein
VTQGIGMWTGGGPYGGTSWKIAVNPVTPTIVYALMEGAGLFHSLDAGTTWKQVLSALPFSFAFDPTDPNTIYVGSWDLWKSTDGGETWTWIPNPIPGWPTIEAILVHPTQPNTIYMGLYGYGTDNGGFRRSEDGGLTWQVMENGLTDRYVADMQFDPSQPNTIYLVTHNGRVFRTTDGSETWTFLAKPAAHLGVLEIDPHSPHDLWAGSGGNMAYLNGGVFTSTLADPATWYTLTEFIDTLIGGTSFAFDPQNPGTVYVAAHCSGHKTTDGGRTWQHGLAGGIQIFAFAVSPDNPQTVYASHWGHGLKKSTDGGETWGKINQGLAAIVPGDIAVAPGHPDEVYLIAYDMYWSDQGGYTWKLVQEYIGGVAIAVDPFTPTRAYLAIQGIKIGTNHGQMWTYISVTTELPAWCSDCIYADSMFAITADPSRPGHLLTCMSYGRSTVPSDTPGRIFASYDFGLTWQAVEPDVPRGAVDQFVFSPVSPTIVYARGYLGILKSTDGGDSWQQIAPPELADKRPRSIAVHPRDPNIVYVASCGQGTYRSQDGGASWTRLNEMCGVLLYPPETPDTMYFGADGLYRSTDDGETWTRASGHLGTVNVIRLASGSDGERFVLYVGTPGGTGPSGASRFVPSSAVSQDIVSPGVYRYTTRLVGLQESNIGGPTTGLIHHSYTFTATVGPISAALPLLYAWQATGQSPVTHTAGSVSDSATFAWAVTGTQVITVTAANAGGTVISTHNITVELYHIYLPLVLRGG